MSFKTVRKCFPFYNSSTPLVEEQKQIERNSPIIQFGWLLAILKYVVVSYFKYSYKQIIIYNLYVLFISVL